MMQERLPEETENLHSQAHTNIQQKPGGFEQVYFPTSRLLFNVAASYFSQLLVFCFSFYWLLLTPAFLELVPLAYSWLEMVKTV